MCLFGLDHPLALLIMQILEPSQRNRSSFQPIVRRRNPGMGVLCPQLTVVDLQSRCIALEIVATILPRRDLVQMSYVFFKCTFSSMLMVIRF